MESLQGVQETVQRNLNGVLQNPYVMAVLKVTLVLYAARLAPRLPSAVQDTFENTFVKILAVALLAYISEVDFQLAILLAIVLVLGANLLSGRGMLESYQDVGSEYHQDMKKYTTLLGKPAEIGKVKLVESLSDNYPGCNKITMKDLLGLFDGDALKLQKTVQYAFADLNRMLPPDADAKTKLTQIARAVGLPYNIEMNDENAPLLATLLLQYGYSVSDTCTAPQ
jgi:hypothetical protein